jgi:hypothetical protein
MPNWVDWGVTTFEGNRLRQHQEFMRLSFRDKLLVIERLCELTPLFESARRRGETRPRAVTETEG